MIGLIAEQNRRKYTIPGGNNYQLRSKNAIYISPSNSLRHELAKCVAAYMLRKWGDIKFEDDLTFLLKEVEDYVELLMKGFPKSKADFISEAVPKKDRNRRIDLVRLDDDVWFEFETKNVDKGDCVTLKI